MTFDITNIPFSYRGSYWAFSSIEKNGSPDLYLRNVRESCSQHNYNLFKIELSYQGELLKYSLIGSPEQLIIKTIYGEITICFHDVNTILIHSHIPYIQLKFELTYQGPYTYFYTTYHECVPFTICNLPKNRIRMAIKTFQGNPS